ncbi:MAG: DUF4870 domain-containing protein [Flavobacteriales bacterium]
METIDPTLATSTPTPTGDERTIALLAHILTLVGGFIAPLVVYLVKKDESPFITQHAKESLNFQITLILAMMASAILIFIFIGFILMFVVGIGSLVLVIMATIKASEGKPYRYPVNIRFIS